MKTSILLTAIILSLFSGFRLDAQNASLQEKRFANLVKKRDMEQKQLILFKKMKKEGKRISDAQIASKQMKLEQVQAQLAALAKQLNKQVPASPFAPKEKIVRSDKSPLNADQRSLTELLKINRDNPDEVLAATYEMVNAMNTAPMIDFSFLNKKQLDEYHAINSRIRVFEKEIIAYSSRIRFIGDFKTFSQIHQAVTKRKVEIEKLVALATLADEKWAAAGQKPRNTMFGVAPIETLPIKLAMPKDYQSKQSGRQFSISMNIPFNSPNSKASHYLPLRTTEVIDNTGRNIFLKMGYFQFPRPYAMWPMKEVTQNHLRLSTVRNGTQTINVIKGIIPLIEIQEEKKITINNLSQYENSVLTKVKSETNQEIIDQLGIQVKYAKYGQGYKFQLSLPFSNQRCIKSSYYSGRRTRSPTIKSDNATYTSREKLTPKHKVELRLLLKYKILELPFEVRPK